MFIFTLLFPFSRELLIWFQCVDTLGDRKDLGNRCHFCTSLSWWPNVVFEWSSTLFQPHLAPGGSRASWVVRAGCCCWIPTDTWGFGSPRRGFAVEEETGRGLWSHNQAGCRVGSQHRFLDPWGKRQVFCRWDLWLQVAMQCIHISCQEGEWELRSLLGSEKDVFLLWFPYPEYLGLNPGMLKLCLQSFLFFILR